ncbi:MAG: pilus assembly protein TadG-related protein, partial [Acidimicrobiia bacterium]|nr:pilus assembly protein TadG-related protein [Acidimicrobiia bacterium]
MIRRLRDGLKLEDQRGAALVWVAGSLVMLLAFSALAVDLAWIYVNSSRLQNAADSAALAGVVNLPGAPAVAQSDAEDAAQANGFPVGGANTVTASPLSDNSLHVTLTTAVPTYFLKVLGFNSFDVSRESTAQYVKPVPLGSPSSCFGIGSLSAVTGCTISAQQNFWAAINGHYTAREHGDPFAPRCDWASSPGNCTDSTSGSSPWDTNTDPLNP